MRCPNGHESQALDYCDTCGSTMDTTAALDAPPEPSADPQTPPEPGPEPEPAAGDRPCPSCGAPNAPDALFCENCGYDHTTGTMPRRPAGGIPASTAATDAPANASRSLRTPWVAEVWIDPAWYASQGSPDALPSQGLPAVVPLRNASLLVGRRSVSRGIDPDIDCGADNGVSRRHAQLTTDGTRWWVEDLDSSNGTFIGDAVGDLPDVPIPVGRKREVDADDRIYLGSWTRIVLRESTEEEIAALA